ncbi:twin-arginine translocation signal domain-containing protein [Natrialbaceae archaeon A-CW1-1]
MAKIQPSRRDVLKSIGAGSVVAGLATNPVQGSDDTVEIVTGRSGDTPTTTKVVSEEWFNQVRLVREVQHQISNSYAEKDWVRSVGRAQGEREFSDNKSLKVNVKVDNVREAERELPSKIDGVPVMK